MQLQPGTAFKLPQPTTFFIVFRSLDASSSTDAFVFDSRNSLVRQLLGRNGSSGLEMYASNDLIASGITYPFPNPEIWSGTFNQATSAMYRNGIRVAAGRTGSDDLQGLAVGGLSTAGTQGYAYGHSQIAEILYYSGALTDADRQAVTDWLNQKYSILTAGGFGLPPASRQRCRSRPSTAKARSEIAPVAY